MPNTKSILKSMLTGFKKGNKMKVYILTEDGDIVGVWSKRKDAEDFANDPSNSIRNWYVMECEVRK